MEQRVSFVTLVVADVPASRAFYVDGLGWDPEFEADDVLMFRVAEKVVLSLWSRAGFAGETGTEPVSGVPPITLSHNVATPETVDDVLTAVAAAGARVTAGEQRDWGGYSGYFRDPDGFNWEVCYNPGPIGQSVLPR